jgi:hypothetical protein
MALQLEMAWQATSCGLACHFVQLHYFYVRGSNMPRNSMIRLDINHVVILRKATEMTEVF